MSIDPAEFESVGLARPGPVRVSSSSPALAASGADAGGRSPALSERLKRLSAERLAEILIRLTDSQGPEVRRLVDAALRKFSDTMAPDHAELADPSKVPAVAGPASAAKRGGPILGEATLRQTLARHEHNVSSVARTLGVSRMTVYRSMRRYGIE